MNFDFKSLNFETITEIIWSILGIFLAFFLGYFYAKENFETPLLLQNIESSTYQEISILQLKKMAGDSLEVNISGPIRILWGEKNSVEGDGEKNIPLGQIPNFKDLELKNFKYVGNAKTKKFYPSLSYPARGTAYRYRRLFNTKEEALNAGFIASKLVK